jgi:hypothetical protein
MCTPLIRYHLVCIPKTTSQYTFPPSVEQSVRLRDNVCFITGASLDAELDLSWIFPPTWAFMVSLVRFSSIARFDYQCSWTYGLTLKHVIISLSLLPLTLA